MRVVRAAPSARSKSSAAPGGLNNFRSGNPHAPSLTSRNRTSSFVAAAGSCSSNRGAAGRGCGFYHDDRNRMGRFLRSILRHFRSRIIASGLRCSRRPKYARGRRPNDGFRFEPSIPSPCPRPIGGRWKRSWPRPRKARLIESWTLDVPLLGDKDVSRRTAVFLF